MLTDFKTRKIENKIYKCELYFSNIFSTLGPQMHVAGLFVAFFPVGRTGAAPALAQRPQTVRVPAVREAVRALRPPDQAHQGAPAPGLLLPGMRPGRCAERPAQASGRTAGGHASRTAAHLPQTAAVLQQRRLRQQVQGQGAGHLNPNFANTTVAFFCDPHFNFDTNLG